MKDLFFNEVEIENRKIRTEFLRNRLIKQDIKILLLTHYKNNKLCFRNELKITNILNYDSINVNDKVTLICTNNRKKDKLIIGTGIVLEKKDKSINIVPQEISLSNIEMSNNINDLFIPLKSVIINNKQIIDSQYKYSLEKYKEKYNAYLKNVNCNKEKYINGLFKYYYNSLIQFLNDNSNYYSISKITALSSYIIASDFFKKAHKNISLPNVFIRDFNIEFDMLLVKNNYNKHKFIYELNEVDTIVELKSNGIIGYAKDDTIKKNEYNQKRWFEAYITFDNQYKKIKEKLTSYDKSLKEDIIYNKYNNLKYEINNKKFIYFCIYENNRNNTAIYENTLLDIINAGSNYFGIYLAINAGNDYYTIPIDYDIEKILNII